MLQPPHNKEAGLVFFWIVTAARQRIAFPFVSSTGHTFDSLREKAPFTAFGDLVLCLVEAEDGEKEGRVAGVGSYKGIIPILFSLQPRLHLPVPMDAGRNCLLV